MRLPAALKDCEEVRDFLMDYLDGKLPATDSIMFRLHMFLCSPCRRYMGRYTTSVELAKNILDDPPPPELINLTNEFISKRVKEEE
jgi:predicted anti-sigma-YlaC factor YlaD